MALGLLELCNWSTLAVCTALKLPQISALLAARSARGLSLPSLLLELAGFLVFLRYQCYYEYPLLTYLEYSILIIQGTVHDPGILRTSLICFWPFGQPALPFPTLASSGRGALDCTLGF